MRIPSEFNDDNLYRRRGRRSGGQDARQLVRLVIALVLVIVLMQQAAQPVIYEKFFAAFTPTEPAAMPAPRQDAPERSPQHPTLGPGVVANAFPPPDPAVTAGVSDGAVWRDGDFKALYEFLNEAPGYPARIGPEVGALSLLQQPEIFRNQLVNCRGRVVRAQRLEAAENSRGIEAYWQLWLKPATGAERPIVVIASQVSPQVAGVDATGIADDGPLVSVSGRFLKRLAYRSSAGADLAPVIVGRVFAETAAVTESPRHRQAAEPARWGWLMIGAISLGLGIAAGVMWTTGATAKRIRALRQSGRRPDSFLSALAERAAGTDDQRR